MTQNRTLDETDQIILQMLQQQGRIKKGDLAEAVDMSIPSITERIKRLESQGIIKNYHAILNARKIGLEVMAFVTLQVDSSTRYPSIIEHARNEPHILECHAITGAGSHMLKVRTTSTASLEQLLAQIQSWPGVQQTCTHVVLSSSKDTPVMPLDHLEPFSDSSES